MTVEEKLKSLGIALPMCPMPQTNYVPGLIPNILLYLSGQGSMLEDGNMAHVVVGRESTMQQVSFHARRMGLVILSAARHVLGSLWLFVHEHL